MKMTIIEHKIHVPNLKLPFSITFNAVTFLFQLFLIWIHTLL